MKKGSKAPGKGKRAAQVTAVVLAGIILLAAGGVGGWYLKKQFEPKAEVDHNNQIAITPGEEEGGIMALSAETVTAEDGAEVHRLTATLSPAGSTGQIDWSIAWGDTVGHWVGSSWGSDNAEKGEVTEYISLTPTADGALTADVVGLKDFGTQAVITATLRKNPEVKATCAVDYLMRAGSARLDISFAERTSSSSTINSNISGYLTLGTDDAAAYEAAENRINVSPYEFPYCTTGSGGAIEVGALMSEAKFQSLKSQFISSANLDLGSSTSYTKAFGGDEIVISVKSNWDYAAGLAMCMSKKGVAYASNYINSNSAYYATWSEYQALDVQLAVNDTNASKYSILRNETDALRIRDVLIDRFLKIPDPTTERAGELIYDYDATGNIFSYTEFKKQVRHADISSTGDRSKIMFKVEIPKAGLVGYYIMIFTFSANSVSLDTDNLEL